MSRTTSSTPEVREFSFKEWFTRLNGLESRSNEKTYQRAFYNVVGVFLMLIFSAAAWGVFIILQPFLKPLLWALLCGSVIHPFKNTLSKNLSEWIDALDRPSFLVIMDALFLPVKILTSITDVSVNVVYNHAIPIIIVFVIYSVHLFIPQFIVSSVWKLQCLVFTTLFTILKICSSSIVITVLIGVFTWLMFSKSNSEYKKYLKCLSSFTWFAILCYITSYFDLFKVPVFLCMFALFLSGMVYEVYFTNSSDAEIKAENVQPTIDKIKKSDSLPTSQSSDKETNVPSIVQRRKFKSQFNFIDIKQMVSVDLHTGDQYLYWLGCACLFTFFIKWWWTPYVVGLQIIWVIFKKIFDYTGVNKLLMNFLSHGLSIFMTLFDQTKIDILFPLPVIGMYKVLHVCKTNILLFFKSSCDTISTITVLLLALILITIASVFLTMQIYTEGMHLVKVSHKILNETLIFSPQFNRIVPQNWQTQLDSAFENAYIYGRDFISKMVKKLLDGMSDDKVTELERMVLELWDRIYQAWLMNNDENIIGPKVTSDAVYQIWDQFTINIQKTPGLMNINLIMEFVNNNMTTLSSAVKNVWEFTIDNVSLVLYLLETLLSIIFVGGFAVFTFIIDVIIFLTALFYLLSSSSDLYKPVEFITKVSPTYGNKLAVAIERSVTEVFMVSFKLSLFYGLYTWLLHNLFQMHIVYVPTVTAAILAAVPVLPTYCVCIPGILDLWLAQDNTMGAFMLFILQFAPTNVVDVAIYEDIHGGHPYLTGLAMAGGVLCFGMEGAIIGPIVLCCMLVIINFGASLMQEQNIPDS